LDRTTYQTPGQLALDIEIPAGDIVVRANAVNVTTLSIGELRDPDDVRVTFADDRDGGHRLSIEYKRRTRLKWFDDYKVRIEVSVPEGTDLRIGTASANVDATGRLGAAKVRSASGNVTLGEVTGRVDVQAASGDLDVASVGDELSFTSASGDVRVGAVAGVVAVRTASGDVAIQSAATDVRCTTVSGDIELGSVTAGDANLKSVSGDIGVAVASGTRVMFDVSSMSGRTVSELTEGRTPSDPDPTLTLRAGSVSGDIHIRPTASQAAVSLSPPAGQR
jgi:DUF4097 and DUF4098 domain-containing protein YvlB